MIYLISPPTRPRHKLGSMLLVFFYISLYHSIVCSLVAFFFNMVLHLLEFKRCNEALLLLV